MTDTHPFEGGDWLVPPVIIAPDGLEKSPTDTTSLVGQRDRLEASDAE